jgi:hypothetical protein
MTKNLRAGRLLNVRDNAPCNCMEHSVDDYPLIETHKTGGTSMRRKFPMFIATLFIVVAVAATTTIPASALAPWASTSAISVKCDPCTCWFRFLGQCVCFTDGGTTVYGHASGTATTTLSAFACQTMDRDSMDIDTVYVGNGNTGTGTIYVGVPITVDTVTSELVLVIGAEGVTTITNVSMGDFEVMIQGVENPETMLLEELIETVRNPENYTENIALVYPNPATDYAFVKISDNYIAEHDVASVTIQVFDAAQTLLTTLNTTNPSDVVMIPSDKISTSGTYYAVCKVTLLDGADVVVTVPFVVNE